MSRKGRNTKEEGLRRSKAKEEGRGMVSTCDTLNEL